MSTNQPGLFPPPSTVPGVASTQHPASYPTVAPTDPGLDNPGLDDPELNHFLQAEDLAALRAYAHTGAPGSLVLLALPGEQLSRLLTDAFSAMILPPACRELDLRHVSPEKLSWSIEELDRLVLAPAQNVPLLRHVVVLHDAGAISASGFDHLLRLVEEPPAPALFLLCCDELSRIPVTLRSRASLALQLRPVPLEQLLDGTGASAEAAASLARVLTDPVVLRAALASPVCADLLELAGKLVVDPSRPSPAPALSAQRLVGIFERFASVLIDAKLSTTAPKKLRDLLALAWIEDAALTAHRLALDPGTDLDVLEEALAFTGRARRSVAALRAHAALAPQLFSLLAPPGR